MGEQLLAFIGKHVSPAHMQNAISGILLDGEIYRQFRESCISIDTRNNNRIY